MTLNTCAFYFSLRFRVGIAVFFGVCSYPLVAASSAVWMGLLGKRPGYVASGDNFLENCNITQTHITPCVFFTLHWLLPPRQIKQELFYLCYTLIVNHTLVNWGPMQYMNMQISSQNLIET